MRLVKRINRILFYIWFSWNVLPALYMKKTGHLFYFRDTHNLIVKLISVIDTDKYREDDYISELVSEAKNEWKLRIKKIHRNHI